MVYNLASIFQEQWKDKQERIRKQSPYGNNPDWRLMSFIVKSGADLRQEQLALQLISEMKSIWHKECVPVRVYPFQILITSDQSGLIETIRDSVSIHSIKKEAYKSHGVNEPFTFTLYNYFLKVLYFETRNMDRLNQKASK